VSLSRQFREIIRQFYSDTAAFHPQLSITFEAVPEPNSVLLFALGGLILIAKVLFDWRSVAKRPVLRRLGPRSELIRQPVPKSRCNLHGRVRWRLPQSGSPPSFRGEIRLASDWGAGSFAACELMIAAASTA
jgi:hypothetical protein